MLFLYIMIVLPSLKDTGSLVLLKSFRYTVVLATPSARQQTGPGGPFSCILTEQGPWMGREQLFQLSLRQDCASLQKPEQPDQPLNLHKRPRLRDNVAPAQG